MLKNIPQFTSIYDYAKTAMVLILPVVVSITGASAKVQSAVTTVKISADISVEYKGVCTEDPSGEVIDLSGSGSKTLYLDHKSWRCEIEIVQGDTPLSLEMSGTSGNRSRLTTRGAGSKISLKGS